MIVLCVRFYFFCFKQKTAYEMRISDWSSDVCSSDLYGLKACEGGYVLVAGTNASTTIAPWGGREARLGNNPMAICAPCPEPPHFLLDMAMSVAARGKIRQARDEGAAIPEGWAVDAAGKPTSDPVAALGGFLLPFGAHKGSGLSQEIGRA